MIVMETISNTRTWVPYMNPKDCSQGFCSIYCPEWCYIVFPPPPPPFEFAVDNSIPNFSPLVISIIGILASAFLIVSYYAVISKYCKPRDSSSSSRRQNRVVDMESDGNNRDPSLHLQYNVSTNGLDEEMIKSITMLKFKKEDRSVQEIECSICLSEFHDDETLRLLPNCSHAFHQTCIDAWLKSHSNCPLCRANIAFSNCEIIEIPPQEQTNIVEAVETGHEHVGQIGNSSTNARSQIHVQDLETVFSAEVQEVRRSVSMDDTFQGRVSIADVLHASDDDREDYHIRGFQQFQGEVGDASGSRNMDKALHCVMSSARMKRSFSSGRLLFPKRGRGRNTIIPL